MAVALETTIKRYRGLSTDQKPGRFDVSEVGPVGSTFTEIDTGARFVWGGAWPWLRQEQTIETLLNELTEVNREMLAYLKAIHGGHEEHLWDETVEVDYP